MSSSDDISAVLWGILENWDSKPMTLIIAFLLIFTFDNLFCKGLYDVGGSRPKPTESNGKPSNPSKPRRRRPQKSRWFTLHVFANVFVCATAIRPVITCLLDPAFAADGGKYPDTSMFGSASDFPLVMITTAHFYHMVAFSDLSSADYFHHLMFIPTMGIPGLMYKWGPSQGFLCFFISGLPGGVEYLFLALEKMGLVDDKAFMKKLSALQNAWCRWPGILIGVYHVYIGWVYGRLRPPFIFGFIIVTLSSFNAIYYGFMAISAQTKSSIIEQHKLEGDAMFANSGRGIKVNRPGS